MVDVVGLVRETAERLENLPPNLPATAVLAQAHTGFGALTLAAAVLSAQSSSRTRELAAINLAVVAAHEHIAEVVDETMLDDAIDARVIELLDDAENLPRIRVSARWLREAATRVAEATRAALVGLASSADLAPQLHQTVNDLGVLVADIRLILDGPTRLRAARANEYYQRVVWHADD